MNYLKDSTCPWWIIGLFDNPLRRRFQDPERILAGLVKTGQTVLDLGPGYGYFTIPLARMVGQHGKVIAADLQPQMLAGIRRRAKVAGMGERIQLHLAARDRIGVTEPVDFALAFWMLHEVRDRPAFLAEVFGLLRPGAQLLLVEPQVHVNARLFDQEIQAARGAGFHTAPGPVVRLSRAVLLVK